MENAPRRQPVMLQSLRVGAKLALRGNATAVVTGNPEDGSWIFVRFLTHPSDPSKEGSEELVFADDVLQEL